MSQPKYRSTIFACYIGNFVQAIALNVTPILLIPLRTLYGISYGQFGFLVMINFVTQVAIDVLFAKAVDKHGFRRFIVAAQLLCLAGFILFGFAPQLFPDNVYLGLLLGTMLFAGSGGLSELLLSPIVDAIPSKEKDKAMTLLHSFYGWGQAVVVIVTTIAVFFNIHWQIIVLAWAVVPLINAVLFTKVPLCQKHPDDIKIGVRKLLKSPLFIICFLAIAFGGAAEVSMAQWASAFVEKGLLVPKVIGDMLGTAGFAVMLATGRALYASKIKKPALSNLLIYGSVLAFVCYIVAAASPVAWLSILACAVCGFACSLLWPGTLVLASSKMPKAGASLFALLAAGGDLGAAIGPWLAGETVTAGIAQAQAMAHPTPDAFGLRCGLILAAAFPIFCFILHILIKKDKSVVE